MDDDFYPKDAYDDDYFVPIRGEINEVLPGKLYISDNMQPEILKSCKKKEYEELLL